MAKVWNVKVDEVSYNIKLNGSNVVVNGEKLKLRRYKKKTHLLTTDYEIPVGSKNALLVVGGLVGGNKLVIDGKDCATGETYVPVKFPAWSYIFVALHFVNFINGAIGVALAFVGLSATAAISSNQKMNIAVKIILDLLVLIAVYAVIFGIAYAAAVAGI